MNEVVVISDNEDYDSDSTVLGNQTSPNNRRANCDNPEVLPPSVYRNEYYIDDRDILLKVQDTVELSDGSEDYGAVRKGDFFRIQYIIHNLETDLVTLRGWRFRRNYYENGTLPKKINEVCMELLVNDDNPNAALRQGMQTVNIREVFQKRNLIITNKNWPALSFRDHTIYSSDGPSADMHKEIIDRNDVLVCRWVRISHVANSTIIVSTELRRFSESECDPNDRARNIVKSTPDIELTRDWLGYLPKPTRQHSLGDAFAGAGGFSEGAYQAGAAVKWAFDHDALALATYRLNRRETEIFLCEADQFIEISRHSNEFTVAILHISPPCPTFSPAHTQIGQLDDQNSATLFAVSRLIENLKPRVVTLEQTSGIVTHHPIWFRALINMFTSVGYSVRWKVIPLDQLGAAQKRKRLIIIASCPGGVLPPFPRATHGPGLPTHYTTIADALAPLSNVRDVTHHNVHAARPRNAPPYSANSPLRGCITTDGGTNYHPDGKRAFTIRELALVQSLPIYFEFGHGQGVTAIRRQIGNMVPTCAAKALIESVINALDSEDKDRNSANSNV